MRSNFIKTFLTTLILSFTICMPQTAEAKNYKMLAYCLDKISTTENMPEYLTLQVPSQTIANGKIKLENEALLRVKITQIHNAKRGKRDGYIETKLIAYSLPNKGNEAIDVSDNELKLKLSKYKEADYKSLAQTTATTVVSHVVGIPFLNQGVAAVKGAVKPIEGKSRIKSAGISAYKSTPLSYVEKGNELNINPGDKITISFKSEEEEEEEENGPNYEYEQNRTN